MTLKDFKFSEQDIQLDFVRKNNLYKKIDYVMNYLLKHLPINKLDKDNLIDFDVLKINEGKNYDWFFINNDKVIILVRQYRQHFTFFTKSDKKISVFTIFNNLDKVPSEQRDGLYDDDFITLRKCLPQLVDIIIKNEIHTLWNNLSFNVEDYVEVKIAMNGMESVSSLDILTFSCDEIFSKYLCTYAENDVLELIKHFKVGDLYDGVYKVTRVNTEPKDNYIHGCGLELLNTNFENSEPKWCDVYSLAMYYSDGLEYDDKLLKREVKDFIYQNNDKVIDELLKRKDNMFFWLQLKSLFIDLMYDLYIKEPNSKDVSKSKFKKAIPIEHFNFIEIYLRVKKF